MNSQNKKSGDLKLRGKQLRPAKVVKPMPTLPDSGLPLGLSGLSTREMLDLLDSPERPV